jgi:LacI family transcriptional regulator, repressor for deo operon, udp, cdd, tsx, nupC, and nupG
VRIRLREVAQRAGVSEATVSRVVNERPGVNEATRQQVQRVVEELGYEPPGIVGRGVAGLVAVVVPELDNPIFPSFAQAIESRLAIDGYMAVVCSATRDGVREQDFIDVLLNRNAAGIVVVSGRNANSEADHESYRLLAARGFPLVLVNGAVDGVDAPFVSCDDRYAAELAVRHLVSLGHERIGCVLGPPRYVPAQRRLEGFEAAMKEVTGDLDADFVEASVFSVEGGHVAARRLLRREVTAIVASSDLMALGIIRAAREDGRSVPEEISVVGYDDSPLMAFTDPPLTTVRQPVRAMSETAVRALLDLLRGRAEHCHEYVFRPELVVRGSTGPRAAAAAGPPGVWVAPGRARR